LSFLAIAAWAEPYRPKETKRSVGRTADEVVIEYAIEGSPFRMVETVQGLGWPIEVHFTSIYREGRERSSAFSEIFVFHEKAGTRAFVRAYRKSDQAPDTKGLGTLVLHPILANPNVAEVRADLAHSNYDRMTTELERRGLKPTVLNYNEVVLAHSHLGKALADAGFGVDETETFKDPWRFELSFRFERPAHVSTCSRLISGLGNVLRFFRRTP